MIYSIFRYISSSSFIKTKATQALFIFLNKCPTLSLSSSDFRITNLLKLEAESESVNEPRTNTIRIDVRARPRLLRFCYVTSFAVHTTNMFTTLTSITIRLTCCSPNCYTRRKFSHKKKKRKQEKKGRGGEEEEGGDKLTSRKFTMGKDCRLYKPCPKPNTCTLDFCRITPIVAILSPVSEKENKK